MANTPKAGMAKLAKIQAEIASFDGVQIEIRGQVVGVKAFGEWTQDALEDLNAGAIRAWTEGALTEDGLEVWQELKPTVDEVLLFFAEYNKSSGQDLGK